MKRLQWTGKKDLAFAHKAANGKRAVPSPPPHPASSRPSRTQTDGGRKKQQGWRRGRGGKRLENTRLERTVRRLCKKEENETPNEAKRNQTEEHAGNNGNEWKVIYKIKNINRMSG